MKHTGLPLLLTIALLTGSCGGGSGDSAASDSNPVTVIVPALTPQYPVSVERDIVYSEGEINGGGTFKDMLLDLYIPDTGAGGSDTKFPVLIILHGGGFEAGSKNQPKLMGYMEDYASRGWLVVGMNYRLEPEDPIPSERVRILYDDDAIYFAMEYCQEADEEGEGKNLKNELF